MDKKMPWNEKLESRYYFSNSELVCNVSTLSQLSLGLAIYIVYSLFSRQMINALIGIGLGVISTYFLGCGHDQKHVLHQAQNHTMREHCRR